MRCRWIFDCTFAPWADLKTRDNDLFSSVEVIHKPSFLDITPRTPNASPRGEVAQRQLRRKGVGFRYLPPLSQLPLTAPLQGSLLTRPAGGCGHPPLHSFRKPYPIWRFVPRPPGRSMNHPYYGERTDITPNSRVWHFRALARSPVFTTHLRLCRRPVIPAALRPFGPLFPAAGVHHAPTARYICPYNHKDTL